MATNGNPELTTRQRRAVVALLTERNVTAAAKTAGVGERTLHTWLAEPAFRAELRAAEAAAIDAAARRLVALADGALTALADVLADGGTSGALRLRAAELVLGHMLKVRELAAIEARVCALEARAEPAAWE